MLDAEYTSQSETITFSVGQSNYKTGHNRAT